jgi:hypothetical protein
LNSAVEHFAGLAKRFREWVNEEPGWGSDDARSAHELLIRLLSAAIDLPKEKATEGAPKPPREDMTALVQRIRKRFADLPVTEYWEITDPVEATKNQDARKPTAHYLANDFTEIYIDLMDGLWLYEQKLPKDACFEWKLNFDTHWERHALSALRVIYTETW